MKKEITITYTLETKIKTYADFVGMRFPQGLDPESSESSLLHYKRPLLSEFLGSGEMMVASNIETCISPLEKVMKKRGDIIRRYFKNKRHTYLLFGFRTVRETVRVISSSKQEYKDIFPDLEHVSVIHQKVLDSRIVMPGVARSAENPGTFIIPCVGSFEHPSYTKDTSKPEAFEEYKKRFSDILGTLNEKNPDLFFLSGQWCKHNISSPLPDFDRHFGFGFNWDQEY